MSKLANIDSLKELRARKAEIQAENQAARQGLVSSLSKAPSKVAQFAYEDLALPAMGIGLAVYVGYRLLRSRKKTYEKNTVDPPTIPQALPAQEERYIPETRVWQRPQPEAEPSNATFSIDHLLTAGRILVPAAMAIFDVVKQNQPQQTAPDERIGADGN